MILKCNQQVACLWNASSTIFKLGAMTVVICEFWATIQPVLSCELWINNPAVSRESYQSALYQVCIISLYYYGASFRKKLITFITPTLIFVRHQSIFRATQKLFNHYNIFTYNRNYFLSTFAALNILSRHKSLFWVSHSCFLWAQCIFCDSHNFAVQHNFYVYFFI